MDVGREITRTVCIYEKKAWASHWYDPGCKVNFVLEELERDPSRCTAPKSASVQLKLRSGPFIMRFSVQDPEHDVSEELQQDPRDAHEPITGSSPFI